MNAAAIITISGMPNQEILELGYQFFSPRRQSNNKIHRNSFGQ
jgi:hypothetical protein